MRAASAGQWGLSGVCWARATASSFVSTVGRSRARLGPLSAPPGSVSRPCRRTINLTKVYKDESFFVIVTGSVQARKV